MKPAPFDYVRPDSVSEAAAFVSEHGSGARILAGGQSLIAMLNTRVAKPRMLVDISQLDDGNYIRLAQDHVEIGCATRQRDLEHWPQLQAELPLLAMALPMIGHAQTRSRGTVCGSIAHADPSSELPLCLAVMNGTVTLRSGRSRRDVPARDFFMGMLQTACKDKEIIEEIRIPRSSGGDGAAFREMAIRHGDFAIVAVAVIAREDGLSIGVGGAADRPATRQWPVLEGEALADALNELAWSLDCQDDLHATAVYRRQMIRNLGRAAVEDAVRCRS
jgi:2-furoyl-CoA dehydrogenase FAD binding subunit